MINIPMEQLMLYIMIALSVICVILAVLVITVLCKLKTLKRRIDSLSRGKDTESLEDIILNLFEFCFRIVNRRKSDCLQLF